MQAFKSLDLNQKSHLTGCDFRIMISNKSRKSDPDELGPAVEEAMHPASGIVDFQQYTEYGSSKVMLAIVWDDGIRSRDCPRKLVQIQRGLLCEQTPDIIV
jgi:hypothetical protein